MVHPPISRRAAAYLIVIILLAVHPLLFGRFWATGDMYDVFLPLEDFFHKEQLAGRLPAWNPDIAWGFPVIASAQIGFFYPPLLVLRMLPVAFYLPLTLGLHIFFLAAGTYLFARREGLSLPGALVAATSTALSSFVFQHITHPNIILAVAWLPWQFLAMKQLAALTSRRHQILAALAVGLPFLAGQLHIPFLLALTSTVYYVTNARGQRLLQIGKTIIPVLLLGAALAAAQLVPTLELLQHSSRGDGGDFALTRANQLSWPLYHLPTVFFPRFFGVDDTYWGKRLEVEYGIFIGTLPLLVAFASLRRAWAQHRFFFVAALISFLLALGDLSPFRLIGLEPSLWYFSAPARWLLIYTFATSILAGAGFDYLCQHPQKVRRAAIGLLIILTVGVLLYNAALALLPADSPARATAYLNSQQLLGERPLTYYEEKFTSLLTSLQTSGASLSSPYTWLPLGVLLLTAVAARTKYLPSIILAVTALEMCIIAATASPTIPWSIILAPPSTVVRLPAPVQEKQARIFSVPLEGDTGLWLTNPASRPGKTARERQRALLLPASHARFNIAGSTWPASLDLQSHNEALIQLSREELNIGAVLSDPYPADPDATTEILHLRPEPRASLALNEGVSIPLPYPTDTPTHLQWTIDAPDAAQLIVRDTFYPGWQATIDGQPAPIKIYKDVFRQIDVPRGQHTVTMTYQPASIRWGLAMSAGALFVVLLGSLNLSTLAQRMRR